MAVSDKKKRVQITLDKKTLTKLEEVEQTSPYRKSAIVEMALENYFNQNRLQNP